MNIKDIFEEKCTYINFFFYLLYTDIMVLVFSIGASGSSAIAGAQRIDIGE